jgi:hypothetical protein
VLIEERAHESLGTLSRAVTTRIVSSRLQYMDFAIAGINEPRYDVDFCAKSIR